MRAAWTWSIDSLRLEALPHLLVGGTTGAVVVPSGRSPPADPTSVPGSEDQFVPRTGLADPDRPVHLVTSPDPMCRFPVCPSSRIVARTASTAGRPSRGQRADRPPHRARTPPAGEPIDHAAARGAVELRGRRTPPVVARLHRRRGPRQRAHRPRSATRTVETADDAGGTGDDQGT